MSEFKASNGIRRDFMEDLEEGLGYSFMEIDALAEFFQHKHDEEFGRWRWPENPGYVVYRKPEYDDEDGRAALVLDERSGEGFLRWERVLDSGVFGQAARAYFEAHPEPEPKPWHDAKPGEVWEITYKSPHGNDVSNRVMTCVNDGGNISFFNDYRLHTIYYTNIESARRIWPEVD